MRAPKKGLELFARNENRVLRPADFRDVYANPWDMFGYYVGTGALIKAARGYYLLVPESQRGGHWTPEVEAVGLGMAVADYGRDAAALIGPSVARVLGAILGRWVPRPSQLRASVRQLPSKWVEFNS